ncbi:hypothetical protein Cgig2_021664 [Carnegiea gigantea]|uniref:Uncharacterized protein n=1 Tax=Carnegiea gigantea TaxID=171969 RepID=A0A9Q1KB66_9CARY|nr:hypothetical protein Cgig2_021664 [Carnegiea gigantea]
MEKAKEKGLPNKLVDKVAEKRKYGKDHTEKPLSKKAKREKFPMDLGKGDKPAWKSAVKGEENKQSSAQIAAKNVPNKDEGHQKSPKKPEDKEKHIRKAPATLKKKEKGDKEEETKKHKLKEKPLTDGQPERMRQLSKAAVQKGHVSDVELSYSSDSEENDPTYECEEVDHDDELIEAKEEVVIHETVKPAQKRNKQSLGKDLQFIQKVWALKFEEGASEKRTYQKAFFMRMTTRSFSSVVAQLNEDQVEAARSMRCASFLKVDLKQIPGKFSKWLVECFDPYAVYFRLPDGQNVPFKGREIIEITKPSTDEEYDEVHTTWLKEWKIE